MPEARVAVTCAPSVWRSPKANTPDYCASIDRTLVWGSASNLSTFETDLVIDALDTRN
jgi:hypothetical protein